MKHDVTSLVVCVIIKQVKFLQQRHAHWHSRRWGHVAKVFGWGDHSEVKVSRVVVAAGVNRRRQFGVDLRHEVVTLGAAVVVKEHTRINVVGFDDSSVPLVSRHAPQELKNLNQSKNKLKECQIYFIETYEVRFLDILSRCSQMIFCVHY